MNFRDPTWEMSMETHKFEITPQDIDTAESQIQTLRCDSLSWPKVGPTPASVALERSTGSKWKTVGSLMLIEENAPFRFGIVPATLTPRLDQFLENGKMEPCSFSLYFNAAKFSFRFCDPSEKLAESTLEN
jgi:hypothetical protein